MKKDKTKSNAWRTFSEWIQRHVYVCWVFVYNTYHLCKNYYLMRSYHVLTLHWGTHAIRNHELGNFVIYCGFHHCMYFTDAEPWDMAVLRHGWPETWSFHTTSLQMPWNLALAVLDAKMRQLRMHGSCLLSPLASLSRPPNFACLDVLLSTILPHNFSLKLCLRGTWAVTKEWNCFFFFFLGDRGENTWKKVCIG